MGHQSLGRVLKIVMVFTLILGVVAAGLAGGQGRTLAHESQPQTFMVHAGGHSAGNVEVLAFAPSIVQVHRGDSIMWHIASFHNIHLEDIPVQLVIVPEVDGQPMPQLNPAAAFPTIQNGDTYAGGEANSGLPIESPTFSLIIDLEPGRYMYYCDVHPGMVGVIEVVADDVAIPSATEVEAQAQQELGEQIAAANLVAPQFAADTAPVAVDGVLEITVGSEDTGRATINLFSSYYGVIKAGESVTWTNPAGSIEPHFVNSAPYDPIALPEFTVVPQENGLPLLPLGLGFLGTTESGTVIKAGDTFNSTFILPGQSFTLTFNDPGVYAYLCHIHPGMNGVIVVEPAV